MKTTDFESGTASRTPRPGRKRFPYVKENVRKTCGKTVETAWFFICFSCFLSTTQVTHDLCEKYDINDIHDILQVHSTSVALEKH